MWKRQPYKVSPSPDDHARYSQHATTSRALHRFPCSNASSGGGLPERRLVYSLRADGVATSDAAGDVAKALAKEKGLKTLAFTAEGNWAFLFGGNGVIYSGGMPTAFVSKVPELWKVTGNFKGLAFRPQGGWVLLYDKNGVAHDGIPATLRANSNNLKRPATPCSQ